METTTTAAGGRALPLPHSGTVSAHWNSALAVPLFTCTLFTSAFLLFLVQPMVAKMVLPLLGGSPMVWNTCMVFFQIALLAGYSYAHGATKWLTARVQLACHLVLVLLPFVVLPFVIVRDSIADSSIAPIAWLLAVLAGSIGLPFFVLATSASILQHWFSRTDHESAGDPYFLYIASNVGSFAALAAYPVLVEPFLTLRDQSRIWTAGYSVFVILVAACATIAWRGRTMARTASVSAAATVSGLEARPITFWRRARWAALAFIPSSLMLAVTTYLTTDIAAAPLFWIVPLGLYLLTFIAAFSSRSHALHEIARRVFPLVLIPLVLCMGVTGRIAVLFPLHLCTFVAAALLCHTRLAADRPDASRLTEFYLWTSFGGMLGGLFNGLAAPQLFTTVLEYPIALTLACAALPASTMVSSRHDRVLDYAMPVLVGVLTIGAVRLAAMAGVEAPIASLAIPGLLAFTFRRRPLRFAMGIGALLVAGTLFRVSAEPVLHAERTFFGVYRVTEDRKGEYRALAHGTTLHGMQAIRGAEHREPLLHFHRGGPFGQTVASLASQNRLDEVAVVGLGVGLLAAYATEGQHWTFYEIDAAVERIARDAKHFTFLETCGRRCRVEIGDARLSLAKTSTGQYNLIVLDAFSSDSIPVHLMTSEALELYLKRLRNDGIVIFHISNRHVDLAPILGRLAEHHQLTALRKFDRRQPDWPRSRFESIWVAMARSRDHFGSLTSDPGWRPIDIPASTPLWTDDFSNILSVLHLR